MTALTPRSSRIFARTRGCCSSRRMTRRTRLSRRPRTVAVRGRADVFLGKSVANPPLKYCAGAWQRPPPCVRRESPAHQPCGAVATFFSALPSPSSRRTAVRGRCDASHALTVVNPPHKRRAGRIRRSSRHFRRESPAHQLRGAVATLLVPRLSRDPRIPAVRGLGDVPRSASVANPPLKHCAGPSRRSARQTCRETPAQALCGAVATLLAPRLSRIPRRTAVRGIADVLLGTSVAKPPHTGRAGPSRHSPAPHAVPVLCQFVRICLNSLKSSTLLAGSPMQATLGKGQL